MTIYDGVNVQEQGRHSNVSSSENTVGWLPALSISQIYLLFVMIYCTYLFVEIELTYIFQVDIVHQIDVLQVCL